jgi:amino acid adenylation domain-containing protein
MPYLLQQLLVHSAERWPGQEAVRCQHDSYTYEALESASNQAAHVLRQMGVQRGDRVGLLMHKSVEAVAALFGIMKAGAVYVPLDPGAPSKRVTFIVNDCQIKALVSTSEKIALLKAADLKRVGGVVLAEATASTGHDAWPLVATWTDVRRASISAPPDPGLIEDDLAYILYTSGSTGTPKGVMISHRAALTFVNWAFDCFQVQATDRVSNHAPFHFDLSVFDLFTSILAGATIVLVPASLSVFPLNLAKFIAEQRITIWYSVPSVLIRLVLHGRLPQHDFAALRTVLFAGEVFPIKYLRQLMAEVPHARYYNLYGPTETNVCTYYAVPELAPDRIEPLPIGKACANSEVFVINDRHEVAAPGQTGELCVRGPSLMQGYWGVPEKSQEVLVPYTLKAEFGPKMIYRTGDLVCQAPDGNYVFLGRRDNMIKSRGYRIELGEIETALYSHPDIEEAAVIALPDDEIGNQIKGVIVTRQGVELSKSALERFCAERIPKYMIPGIIEFCDTLPKTSTGKIDKNRLRQDTSRILA